MGLFKKVKETTEKSIKKSVEVGKKAGEKTIELSKDVGEKGVEVGKKGIQKVRETVNNDEDPLKILKIRFAKGELSKSEYEEMKKVLEAA